MKTSILSLALGIVLAGAVAAFASHVGTQPQDQLASFHLKRLLNGAKGTRIALE